MRKIICILCLSLFACDISNDDEVLVCTNDLRPGLVVSVRNASDNTTLDNAVVIARDGDFEETLMELTDPIAYFGASERPGVYTLTVERNGFQTFTSNPIVVNADQCHVITREIIVSLQPN